MRQYIFKIIVIFISFSFSIYSFEMEIGGGVGQFDWTPESYEREKIAGKKYYSSKLYSDFSQQSNFGGSKTPRLDLPFQIRFLSNSGKIGFRSSFTRTQMKGLYHSIDILDALQPARNVVIGDFSYNTIPVLEYYKYYKRDVFDFGLTYYITPYQFGLGIGYKEMHVYSKEQSNFNILHFSFQENTVQNLAKGPEISLSYDLNLTGFFEVRLYATAFGLKGSATKTGLETDTSMVNYSNGSLTRSHKLSIDAGESIITRQGAEADLKFVLYIHRNVELFLGFYANYSFVRYSSYRNLELSMAQSGTYNTSMATNDVINYFLNQDNYHDKIVDFYKRIYIGCSYRFGSEVGLNRIRDKILKQY